MTQAAHNNIADVTVSIGALDRIRTCISWTRKPRRVQFRSRRHWWRSQRDSNPPLTASTVLLHPWCGSVIVERSAGLEPASSAWKAEAQPLDQPRLFGGPPGTRTQHSLLARHARVPCSQPNCGDARRIRTDVRGFAGRCLSLSARASMWSGMQDSNLRLPRSKRGCLAADLIPEIDRCSSQRWRLWPRGAVRNGC